MEKNELTILLKDFFAGDLNQTQVEELSGFIEQSTNKQLVVEAISEIANELEPNSLYDEDRFEPLLQKILDADRQAPVKKLFAWKRIAIAASMIFAICIGSYVIVSKRSENSPPAVAKIQDVTPPSTNRAIITLSNGQKVYLDSAGNGTLAQQGNTNLVKTADGKIVYQSTVNGQPSTVQYNTIINPRGSKVIDLVLSDGSHVWLNAASSLRYPVAFIGNERKVEITGEAYFEVAHNAAQPFKVAKGNTEVVVLGTHFNVNAYDDEPNIKVTLLEGSVKVSKNELTGMLKPGQQAQINSEIKLLDNPDLDQVMAWKNGLFKFDGSDVTSVMRQVSRWYDVEIIYEGEKPIANFRGTISRQGNISEVLKMLELTKAVNFRIEGKKVFVTK